MALSTKAQVHAARASAGQRGGEQRGPGAGCGESVTTVRTPINPNAARDRLAHERTFYAWVRSCCAIMALGFVVAGFGLRLRAAGAPAPQATSPGLAIGFGVTVILYSAGVMILATVRYRTMTHAIERNHYQQSPGLILLLTGGLVLVAVCLAAYLVLTA